MSRNSKEASGVVKGGEVVIACVCHWHGDLEIAPGKRVR